MNQLHSQVQLGQLNSYAAHMSLCKHLLDKQALWEMWSSALNLPLPHSFSYCSSFSASSVASEGGWSHILAWDVPEGRAEQRVVCVCVCVHFKCSSALVTLNIL